MKGLNDTTVTCHVSLSLTLLNLLIIIMKGKTLDTWKLLTQESDALDYFYYIAIGILTMMFQTLRFKAI
jgi:hypothetical protein